MILRASSRHRWAVLLGLLPSLTGCAAIIPTSGPTGRQIEVRDRDATSANYVVIDLNQDVVAALAADNNLGLSQRLMPTRPHDMRTRIGAGDILSVTIWEAGEGGLFSSQTNKSANFPQVVVSGTGEISLPYAGLLRVEGRSPFEVQRAIVTKLSDRAIQPQATVAIIENRANTVVLNGEVGKPGLYPLSLKGDHLLDLIAAGGGTKHPARDTKILVIRGEQRAEQLLTAILDDNRENVALQTGDQVYVSYEPRRYTVVGAVQKPGVYPFDVLQVNVLESIAATGGLIDTRADAASVFVFRHERREFVERFSAYIPTQAGAYVPVVYRLNLNSPESYFFARGFILRDKDVVYAANAEGNELSKVLRLIGMASSAAGIGRNISQWD